MYFYLARGGFSIHEQVNISQDAQLILLWNRPWIEMQPGLGRVLDKSTRVQVQVLEKMTSTSTSTSTGFSKVLEYKYKYFEKYLSTSTEYFCCKL